MPEFLVNYYTEIDAHAAIFINLDVQTIFCSPAIYFDDRTLFGALNPSICIKSGDYFIT